ncbi:hypothetical protein LCGC14_1707900 [marine sediment metagenome]|uniref:Uncharacterized protein n=1 Tax=marine sediment metagenome TaxID=412755 RepID=A0A0F9I3P0_9ZZZZ
MEYEDLPEEAKEAFRMWCAGRPYECEDWTEDRSAFAAGYEAGLDA